MLRRGSSLLFGFSWPASPLFFYGGYLNDRFVFNPTPIWKENHEYKELVAALDGSQCSRGNDRLGATFATIGFLASKLGSQQTTTSVILSFVIAVVSGSLKPPLLGWRSGGQCTRGSHLLNVCLVAGNPGWRIAGVRAGLPAFHPNEYGRDGRADANR